MDINIFNLFDEDGDGNITFKEFQKIWKNLGVNRTDIELLEIFNSIDLDGNGTIEYNELKEFFDTKFEKNDIDSINEAFSIIDNNNSRYISFTEFETIIDKLNLDISISHIKTCFYNYDYDKNHKISIKQFTKLIADSTTNMSVFSIIGNMLAFIDQSESNYILKDKSQIKRKELLNNYRWLRTISPFSILSRGRLYLLLENMKQKLVSYNESIISIGNRIDYCYIIFSGEFKLTKRRTKLGDINELVLLKSGSILAIDDILLDSIYNYNIISTTNSSILWCIPIYNFTNILSLDNEFKKTIIHLSNETIYVQDNNEKKISDIPLIYNKTQIDKFKYTRGFVRWNDEYPIRIEPNRYKLPTIQSKKKPQTKIQKKPYKSYSKYGKSLDIVFPNKLF